MKKNEKPPAQKNGQKETTHVPKEPEEGKVFEYQLGDKILNFKFISEKRVKCAICLNEFKNILRHLQQSKCICNTDDFVEKFKEYSKDDAREQKRMKQAALRVKQQEVDAQKFLNDQNKWKARF